MDTTETIEGLKGASAPMLHIIIGQAELRLQAQLQAALAADQRAMTFLGFLLTIIVFLMGAAITSATGDTPNGTVARLAGGGALCLVVPALLAFLATRPIRFRFAGTEPENWIGDAGKPLEAALAEQAGNYQEDISKNRNAMKAASGWLHAAAMIAGLSVIVWGSIAAVVILKVP